MDEKISDDIGRVFPDGAVLLEEQLPAFNDLKNKYDQCHQDIVILRSNIDDAKKLSETLKADNKSFLNNPTSNTHCCHEAAKSMKRLDDKLKDVYESQKSLVVSAVNLHESTRDKKIKNILGKDYRNLLARFIRAIVMMFKPDSMIAAPYGLKFMHNFHQSIDEKLIPAGQKGVTKQVLYRAI